METQEKLLQQLDSLESLQGIVKTMKALSAANIRQYEAATKSLEEYSSSIELGLSVIGRELEETADTGRYRGGYALVVFGSDHGLCGRFNENIVDCLVDHLAHAKEEQAKPVLLAIGDRTAMLLEEQAHAPEYIINSPASVGHIAATVEQILLRIDRMREQDNIQQVDIVYNHYREESTPEARLQPLFPVDMRRFSRNKEIVWPSRNIPGWSMELEPLFAALLRQYFFVNIFRACVESQTSEHSTRLRTMTNAEENIKKRFEEVTTLFRRVRQEEITSELMEVVSGFDATQQPETEEKQD